MKNIKWTLFCTLILSLLGLNQVTLANEDIVKDSDYLEGIESRNLSNIWNIDETGYTEKSTKEDSLPNATVERKEDNENSSGSSLSNQLLEGLNSNYGDVSPFSGKIPLADF